MSAPLTLTPHEPTEACLHVHCHSHHVDEPSYPAYIACAECGHVYRSAAELRRAYRRLWDPLGRRRWRARLSDLWGWLRSRVARARDIDICLECLHDL